MTQVFSLKNVLYFALVEKKAWFLAFIPETGDIVTIYSDVDLSDSAV